MLQRKGERGGVAGGGRAQDGGVRHEGVRPGACAHRALRPGLQLEGLQRQLPGEHAFHLPPDTHQPTHAPP